MWEKGALPKGARLEGPQKGRGSPGSLGMGEAKLTADTRGSFRSWLPRMALATWMWVKLPLFFLLLSFFQSFLSMGQGCMCMGDTGDVREVAGENTGK